MFCSLFQKKHKVEPILYMTEWFMCVYSRTLPWSCVLRVWDMFLCEGGQGNAQYDSYFTVRERHVVIAFAVMLCPWKFPAHNIFGVMCEKPLNNICSQYPHSDLKIAVQPVQRVMPNSFSACIYSPCRVQQLIRSHLTRAEKVVYLSACSKTPTIMLWLFSHFNCICKVRVCHVCAKGNHLYPVTCSKDTKST